MQILENANAKINIGLKVLGKRADGYHEVDMLMQSIALADTLEIESADNLVLETDSIILNNDGAENLVLKAARVLRAHTGCVKGAKIKLQKVIPIAAGLAGGSTDAAAALRGLNRLWQTGLSLSELEQLATQIGSDVAFCVRGGTQRASGRGEILTPLVQLPQQNIVIYKPDFGVSTVEVYRGLNLDEIKDSFVMELLLRELSTQDINKMLPYMRNDLESVTIKTHPIIAQIKKFMVDQGASYAMMSGSGPSIFAITKSAFWISQLLFVYLHNKTSELCTT